MSADAVFESSSANQSPADTECPRSSKPTADRTIATRSAQSVATESADTNRYSSDSTARASALSARRYTSIVWIARVQFRSNRSMGQVKDTSRPSHFEPVFDGRHANHLAGRRVEEVMGDHLIAMDLHPLSPRLPIQLLRIDARERSRIGRTHRCDRERNSECTRAARPEPKAVGSRNVHQPVSQSRADVGHDSDREVHSVPLALGGAETDGRSERFSHLSPSPSVGKPL